MHRLLPLVALGGLAALAACADSTSPVACTMEARSSVSVLVRDASSGEFIASGATLVLQDGAFIDSVTAPAGEPENNAFPLSTANSFERAGVYTVTVRRAGYADWVREGVIVTQGECHVRSVGLTAHLTPM